MRGSIFKRGSRWTVRYDEPEIDGARRQRRRGGFTTRREAERFLAEQIQRLGDGSYTAPAKLTLAAFLIDEWLPAKQAKVRPL